MQESKIIDGVEFRQSPTWPSLFASACGLVCYPSGRVSAGCITKRGYRMLGWCPVSGGQQQQAQVHRVIADAWLGLAGDRQVDHQNGNRQDNQVVNLRYVTSRENQQNMRVHRERSGSAGQYIGCGWQKTYQKWMAQIYADGKLKNLGRYATVEQAAAAYDAALVARGLAPVNFPAAA